MAQHQDDRACSSLFERGRNCWRVEPAARAAFLVDADGYFKAFVEAARKARHSLLIAGWDFHSRTRLLCGEGDEPGLELGDFLNDLARRRRGLHIHILIWDYPMIFGLDREWTSLGWSPHRRVHLRYDNTHPAGGSHHQKIVVIDDVVAFNGGIDLTSRRWDTCDHAPDNALRSIKGTPYPPFHDLMMVVEGETASALGELLRERWRKATGEVLRASTPGRFGLGQRLAARRAGESRWPESVRADLHNVPVAISRTEPAVDGEGGVCEVETLYLDMIAAARNSIYIENQYFTADKIGDALAARLAEADGPELILIVRELSHGWLEELTMQTLRTRLIERLRAADRYDRFRVYYPYIDGLGDGTCIDVHSKMIIVDDDTVRIGSANLANRSLGLDTECDLTIEAQGRDEVRRAIRGLRAQLLSEHLGFSPQQVGDAIDEAGSLRHAIDRLQRGDRTLKPLVDLAQVSEAVLSVVSVADPEKPVALSDLAKLFNSEVPDEEWVASSPTTTGSRGKELPAGPSWGTIAALVLGLAALMAVWELTPLAHFLDGNRITGWARRFGGQWWVPPATMLAYTAAAFTLFPRSLITLFAVIAFGPLLGFVYAMLGIELSAWLTFVVGKRLDRATVRRVAGRRLNDILQVLRQRGLLAITALRLVPLAPFAVESVVAGAARVKLWHFMLGTALGMLPGTLTSTVFGDQLRVWLEDPRRINYWLIAVALLALGAATWIVRRWLSTSVGTSARHGVDNARTT